MITDGPLRSLMEERGITLEELSMISGLPMNTLQMIRKGRNITPYNINVLCKTLRCNPEDIIEYSSKCDYCKQPLKDFKFCPMCGRVLV